MEKKVLKKLNKKQLQKIINNPSWKTIDHSELNLNNVPSYYSMKKKDKLIRLFPDFIIKIYKKIIRRLENIKIYKYTIHKLKNSIINKHDQENS